MTAKEMFEELGYELVEKYVGFICYEKVFDLQVKHCIDFKIRDCSVSMYSKVEKYYGSFNVENNNIFKAIQKQIEELGW